MKHFGQFLPLAGRRIKDKSHAISLLMVKRENKRKELNIIEDEIINSEKELLELMSGEWTKEEIEQAQIKALKYNYNIKVS